MQKHRHQTLSFDGLTLDLTRGCLLRGTHEVKLRPKSFAVLRHLVEHSGRLVSKDELIEAVWPDTAVTDDSLVQCLIEVRRALGDSGQRVVKTVPRRGYVFDAVVVRHDLVERETVFTEEVEGIGVRGEELAPEGPESGELRAERTPGGSPSAQTASGSEHRTGASKRRRTRAVLASAVLLCAVAAAGYLASSVRRGPESRRPPSQRSLVRVTFDSGLQSEPTLSPDAQFVAYSSDRGGTFDVWVQPVSGGDPVRVTKSDAHDWQPDWSPDGSQLVFRSEREGGGLYVVPALGGQERKISSFGVRPRWSPDGSRIMFTRSALKNAIVASKVYVVALDGQGPREVLSELLAPFKSVRIAWHPDGRRASIWGEHRQLGRSFWTAPLAGGPPVASEMTAPVAEQLEAGSLDPQGFLWAPSGDAIYFEGVSRGVSNLWRVEVDPQTLRWTEGPERLTVGPGPDVDLALSRDGKRLVYTTRRESTRITSFPFDATTGELKGAGQPVTPPELNVVDGELSPDGKRLAFIGERAGKQELWAKSLESGAESLLAADACWRARPHWSRDGTSLAYLRSRPIAGRVEHSLVLLPAAGGDERVLTSPNASFELASDWSADGEWILTSSDRRSPGRYAICMVPVTAAPNGEADMRVLASDPRYDLWHARLSRDGRWLAFHGVDVVEGGAASGASNVYVMRAEGGGWVRVTEGEHWNGKPHWSPDGESIYFLSNRAGFVDVWGVRFDPAAGRAVGDLFRVSSFENPSRMISPLPGPTGLSFAADRLMLPVMDVTGSVWMLEL